MELQSSNEGYPIGCQWSRAHFPTGCKSKEVSIGIDEAGRGPVTLKKIETFVL